MDKESVFYYLRILVSVSIFAYIFWMVDLNDLPSLKDTNIYLVFSVLILALLDRVINAYKWSVLVWVAGLRVRFTDLLKIYFTSGFVGLILPSGVGGEFLKGYGLAKATSESIDSASSVVVGRVAGLLGLTGLCVTGYFIAGPELKGIPVIVMVKDISMGLMLVTAFTIVAGLIMPKTYTYDKETDGKLVGFVRRVLRSFYQYSNEKRGLLVAIMLSIFIHVTRSFTVYVASLSIGVSLSFFYFLVLVPFIQLGGMIPITMGGVGVKEGIAVYLFSLVGVAGASALSMYIIVRVMAMASVAPGGWIYFKNGLTVDGEGRARPDSLKKGSL